MTKPLWLNTGYKHNSIIHIHGNVPCQELVTKHCHPRGSAGHMQACFSTKPCTHRLTNNRNTVTRNSSHTGNVSITRRQSTLMALVRWSWHWPGQPNQPLMRMIFFLMKKLLQNYWQYCHLPATGVTDQQDVTIAHMREVPTHLLPGHNHCTYEGSSDTSTTRT